MSKSSISIAVAGSNILEFTQLSIITGNDKYRNAAETAFEALLQTARENSNMLVSHVNFQRSQRTVNFLTAAKAILLGIHVEELDIWGLPEK